MNTSVWIYMVFFCAGTAVFVLLRPATAVALVYISGLIFLPVAHYVPADFVHSSSFTVIPTALPGNHLINKSWIAALTASFGALLFDYKSMRRFRPAIVDLPMIGWCMWPLIQSFFLSAGPSACVSTLYLTGVWGLPWLLGRIYFDDTQSRLALFDCITGLSLLLLPIAVTEALGGMRIYEWLYGAHPFADIGAERYAGYRPLAMFEDGNQYGLWMACMAVIAVWRARMKLMGENRIVHIIVAVLFCLASLGSQSIGAMILMVFGVLTVLLTESMRTLQRVLVPVSLAMTIGFCVYISGIVPLRAIAKDTVAGQTAMAILKASDRSSFSWRISQDEKVMPTVRENLAIGSGQWDWWRNTGTRPWGLPLLLIGQFGMIGLFLAIASPTAAFFSNRSLSQPSAERQSQIVDPSYSLISVIMLMAALDALLNAFIFLPAILFAGSLQQHIKN